MGDNEPKEERTDECKGCIMEERFCEVCKKNNFEYYCSESMAWYPQ